jgi:hypothetical protein
MWCFVELLLFIAFFSTRRIASFLQELLHICALHFTGSLNLNFWRSLLAMRTILILKHILSVSLPKALYTSIEVEILGKISHAETLQLILRPYILSF